MEVEILKKIYALRDGEIDLIEHDCTSEEIIQALFSLLNEIVLVDEDECDSLDRFEQLFRELRCKMNGHSWFDAHCGYWGHKYCTSCNTHKYPELGVLSCSEATKTFRGTEEQYENR